MKHHPYVVRFVQADLDEMVSRAERAKLRQRSFNARIVQKVVLEHRAYDPILQIGETCLNDLRDLPAPPHPLVVPSAVVGPAVRHGAFDRGSKPREVVGKLIGAQRRLDRHHPASEIDPDACRDDRAFGHDDASDRRSDARVHVRHDRQVLVDERHPSRVPDLIERGVLERYPLRPGVNGNLILREGGVHFVGACDVGHRIVLFP